MAAAAASIADDFLDDEEFDDDSQFDSDDDFPHFTPQPPTDPLSASFPSAGDAADLTTPFQNPNPEPIPAFNGTAADPLLYLTAPTPTSTRKRRRTAASEESRRIFQKLFTDEDEITILQGFLEFTTQRGTTHADYQYDTGPFFDQIRTRLQPGYNKNQLVEKLRRLKRKYRNAAARIAAGKPNVFKCPHDRATFEISQKIWSSSFKRPRKPRSQSSDIYINGAVAADVSAIHQQQLMKEEPVEVNAKENNMTAALPAAVMHTPTLSTAVTSAVEETVRSCLMPLFKELVQCVTSGTGGLLGAGLGLTPPAQLSMLGPGSAAAEDERWKQQQILELETILKRTELVQDQIKSALEELRSAGAEQRSS